MRDSKIIVAPVAGTEDQRDWDAYVTAHPDGSYGELTAWRDVLTATFGLEDHLYLARTEGRVVGLLGVFINRPFLGGAHALTAPLTSSGGGFHADTPAVADALLAEAERLTQAQRLRYTLLRLRTALPAGHGEAWTCSDAYVRFVLDLEGGPDEVWRTRFRDKSRNQVRKAEGYGFTVRTGRDQLQETAAVIQRGMQELGTPSPGLVLWRNAVQYLPDNVDFLVVYDGTRPAGAAVLAIHGDTLAHPWCVTLRAYRPQCVNMLLHWEIVKYACARGARWFDLGRSPKDSGTYHFKKRLRSEECPLYYYHHWPGRKQETPLPPAERPVFEAASHVWRRLPGPLARGLGPMVLKQLL